MLNDTLISKIGFKIMDKLIDKLDGNLPDLVGFGVNRWGSCQYAAALDMFDVLTALQNKIGLQETLNEIELQIPIVLSFEKSKNKFYELIKEHYSDSIFDDKREEKLMIAKNVETVDQMFDFCRNNSWDLWSATPQIAECIFDKNIDLNYKSPGVVQSINYNVGILCWLLCKVLKIVNESSFEDFDT